MSTCEKWILFLSLEDVIKCGGSDIELAALDIQKGFERLIQGKVIQPCKTTLKDTTGEHEHTAGLVNVLPSYINLGDEAIFGCKVLGAMPPNVDIGLPRASGLVNLFDSITKTPLCVMEAQVISATRTGAVTLLAARKIADPETEEIGLIGAGVNMRTQLLGLSLALPKLKKVRIYSRGESKYIFAKEMGEKTGLNIEPVESAPEAVEDCKLIVTCLPNMKSPVVKADWVRKKGVTVINIGCYESEINLLKRMDRVIADIWEQGKHRGIQTHAIAVREGVISEDLVEDLGPLITGKVPGRQSSDENIFFAPTGLGFEDAVVAWRVYKEAVKQDAGVKLSLWKSSKWV